MRIVNLFKYPPDMSVRSWTKSWNQNEGGKSKFREERELKSMGKEEIAEKLLLLWKKLHFLKCLNMLNVIIKPTNENSVKLPPKSRRKKLLFELEKLIPQHSGRDRWSNEMTYQTESKQSSE